MTLQGLIKSFKSLMHCASFCPCKVKKGNTEMQTKEFPWLPIVEKVHKILTLKKKFIYFFGGIP